jgi:uncharacterized membrane protein YbhN (UPF0104 family)
MGLIAHLRSVVHALGDLHPGWLGVAVGAEVLSLPGYALAYRTIVRRYGYRQLPLRVTVDMVLAGFGLFAVLGGFSFDRLSLRGLGADPKRARDSILALGLTEIVTLAAVAFVASIALLAGGSAVPGSMLWPWVIGVPGVGLAVAGLLVAARRGPRTFGARVQYMTTRGGLPARPSLKRC